MTADRLTVVQKMVASAQITPTRVAARFSQRKPDMPNAINRIVDTADAAAYAIHRAN
jgi:hypothetical protein